MADENDRQEVILHPDHFADVDNIPDNIIELIDQFPFIVGGESDEELAIVKQGICACCRRAMGEHTHIVLDGQGILSLTCSGVCHDDLMILGYLHEQATDVISRMEMRHNLTEGHD